MDCSLWPWPVSFTLKYWVLKWVKEGFRLACGVPILPHFYVSAIYFVFLHTLFFRITSMYVYREKIWGNILDNLLPFCCGRSLIVGAASCFSVCLRCQESCHFYVSKVSPMLLYGLHAKVLEGLICFLENILSLAQSFCCLAASRSFIHSSCA